MLPSSKVDENSMKVHYFHLGNRLISQREIIKGLIFCLKATWLEPSFINLVNEKRLFDSFNEGLRIKHETTKTLIGLSQAIICKLVSQMN